MKARGGEVGGSQGLKFALRHTILQTTAIPTIHLGERGKFAGQRGGNTLLGSHGISQQSWVSMPGPQCPARGLPWATSVGSECGLRVVCV